MLTEYFKIFGHTWYFSTIRKYVCLFGTLFNDIHITRTDASGNTTHLIKVPLSYGPKEKMLSRIDGDPNIDRESALTLPRMSFEIAGYRYDQERKLNSLGKIAVKDTDTNKAKYQYNPVPWNFDFSLSIYVKNAEDGTKIIEQILPFFTPEWTSTVNLIPEMNVIMDIPVILNSISSEDTYTGDFSTRRALIWTLNFTLKGYLYGPIKKNALIKFANTNFYIPDSSISVLRDAVGVSTPIDRVTVEPGLDANGDAINIRSGLYANGAYISNVASTSIGRANIEADDDFGFITGVAGIILSE